MRKAPLWAVWAALVLLFAAAESAAAGHPLLSNNSQDLLRLKEELAAEQERQEPGERPRDAGGGFLSLPGDSFNTAILIPSLPFVGTGNTCAFSNDYDASCAGGPAADLVFYYVPAVNQTVSFSLCGSSYDTQLSVFENGPMNEIACNDDYCGLQSFIDCIELLAGRTYYIVVDGFGGGSCGDYELEIAVCGGCETDCPPDAQIEGESVCYDDYLDDYNGGCNSVPPVFTPIVCQGKIATVCGTAGTYIYNDLDYRDTDWYSICVEESTLIGACVNGDFVSRVAIIQPGSGDGCDLDILCIVDSDVPCQTACCEYYVGPGEYWIFVATAAFSGVPCGSPYTLHIRGCSPCEPCEAQQPILVLGDVQTVSYVWPLWEVQVRLTNSGPGTALTVSAEMGSDLAWLQIPDPTCYYGDLDPGEFSYGHPGDPSYMFDLTDWPGGSLNAWFDVTYYDSCDTPHVVHLDPDFLDPEEATAVASADPPSAVTRLFPNKPNPFNPQTTISFEIPRATRAEVLIFNGSGRLVRELWRGELDSGEHSFVWSGNDGRGNPVPSGAYFYRLRTDDFAETKRMVLIR
jgi:hypothetical protein